MSDKTRRNFLAIAGVGAAGVAVAGIAGSGKATAATADTAAGSVTPTALPSDASGPLVAHVGDVRDGQLTVMAGEREVVIRDRELVARLARAVAE